MKRLAAISNVVGTGLITTAVITVSLFIPAVTSKWCLPLVVALTSITILLPLTNAASQKPMQLFAEKLGKKIQSSF